MSMLWVVSLLYVLFISPLWAVVIYDNSQNDLLGRFNPGRIEIGDEIGLAGTERFLTYFSFEFWGTNTAKPDNSSFAGVVEARVRFYLNDGPPDANGYITPGTVFYDSLWFGGFSPTPRSTFIFTEGADFPSGGLFIPADRMTWSVQFRGMQPTDTLGVDIYCPPAVGWNWNDYWENLSGWALLQNMNAPNGQMNFGAYMEAVPEPSAVAILLIGGGMMLLARRSPRRE